MRTEFESLEFGWRGRWAGIDVGVDVGVESRVPDQGSRDTGAFGYLSIRRGIQP